jgi:hypothetical protein
MNKNCLLFFNLSILLLSGLIFNKSRAGDLDNVIGQWSLYDSSNSLIDTINVTIAIKHNDTTRFTYQQSSHSNSDKTSQQGIIVDNLIIFDLIKLGYAKTYVAKINEASSGGGGIEISNKISNCTIIGNDASQVARKFRSRLTNGSARCDGSLLYSYSKRNIKIARNGTNPSSITTGGSPDSTITNNLEDIKKKLLGIWDLRAPKQKTLRLINKNIETNFLGYQFIYKLVDPSINLLNLSQTDFKTGPRMALLVDNYLILNPTTFDKENQLLVFKMRLKKGSGSGKQYRTFNGDCVPLRKPANSVKICTPSDQSTRKPINTKQISSFQIKKTNTKVSVNF